MRKRCFCVLLAFIMLVMMPSTSVLAKEAVAPVGEAEEVFMTLDEFLQFYKPSKSKNFFYLKQEFLPYEKEIAVDRFYNKLRRIEGKEFEYTFISTNETISLPLYSIGDIFVPSDFDRMKNSMLISEFRLTVLTMVGTGIAEAMDFDYDCISVIYDINGKERHGIIFIQEDENKLDPDTDIMIALDIHQYYSYDKCADYTYPTEEEYYERYVKSSEPTETPVPTSTPTPEPTSTPTPEPTSTPTPEPTSTPTPVPTSTPTPVPTSTPTPVPTSTPTPVPTSTPTPEPTSTPTPVPTSTPTPEPTSTPTPVPTSTPTPEPTSTPTPVPTSTPTPEPTSTPTPVPTSTPTPVPTSTPTPEPTCTPTQVPTLESAVHTGDSDIGSGIAITVIAGIAVVTLLSGGYFIMKRKKK